MRTEINQEVPDVVEAQVKARVKETEMVKAKATATEKVRGTALEKVKEVVKEVAMRTSLESPRARVDVLAKAADLAREAPRAKRNWKKCLNFLILVNSKPHPCRTLRRWRRDPWHEVQGEAAKTTIPLSALRLKS